MLEWMQQFMNPANTDQIAGLLAQRSAPPPDVLAFAQGQGQPAVPMQSPLNPGQGGFAYALNPQGQNANALLPVPQANFGPDFTAPAMQVPQQPVKAASPQLTAEQLAQLAPDNAPQQPAPAHAPSPMGGHGVNSAQMLQLASPAQRMSLAQILSGRR